MTKITVLAFAGLTLLLVIMLAFAALGLAVREGKLDEIEVWLPPGTRYQVIVRIGEDRLPWTQSGSGQTAINMWMHWRGTPWHIARLVHVPLGAQRGPADRAAP